MLQLPASKPVRLDRSGSVASPDVDHWSAVHAHGLIYSARPLTTAIPYIGAEHLARHSTACGFKWRMPTLLELQRIVDYGRHHSVLDPEFFDLDRGKLWTSTPTSWCDSKHWCIEAYSGSVIYQEIDDIGLVIAVSDYPLHTTL